MIQASEALQLLLFFVFAPFIVSGLRDLYVPARRWMLLGFASLVLSYVFTMVEGLEGMPIALNTLEHAAFAVSGACFAGSALVGMKHWHFRGGVDAQ